MNKVVAPVNSSPPQKLHSILVVEDNHGTRTYILRSGICSLGRGSDNTIQLKGDYVSRNHAYLVPVEEEGGITFRLFDGENGGNTPSTNGLFVNGKRVIAHTLSSGEVIHLGPKVHATFLQATSVTGTVYTLRPDKDAMEVDTDFVPPLSVPEMTHQAIPAEDWYLDDYLPSDFLDLIHKGHFNHPQSATNLAEAIRTQRASQVGVVDLDWLPVLVALEMLHPSAG